MFTIYLDEDNKLKISVRERIIQGSNMTENMHFLVPKMYGEYDISTFECMLGYITPVSKEYKTEILEQTEGVYKEGYVEYLLPIDTSITSEAGYLDLQLTFVKSDIDELGKTIQYVRKTDVCRITIEDKHKPPTVTEYINGGGGGTDREHVVFTVEQEDVTDVDTASTGLVPHNGDVLVIKNEDGVASGYQYYDNTWCAFTGNVYDYNVIMSDKIILAGNYVNVGNVNKGSTSATSTLDVKGKTLKEVMQKIFTQELQPTKSEPSANISFPQAGAKEVGTSITPAYSASLNTGSYTYDSTTGVVAESYNVTDTDGHTSTTQTGTFDSFVVTDTTNYSMTVTITHSSGNVAKTNLGNNSSPEVKITAGTKTKKSGSITGYRKLFYGVLNDTNPLSSSVIRGLTDGGAISSKTVTVKINGNKNAKRIIVAIPKASGKKVTKVNKTDGLVTDITSTYSLTEVMSVDGCNNVNDFAYYNIWTYQPASIDSAEVHEITIS